MVLGIWGGRGAARSRNSDWNSGVARKDLVHHGRYDVRFWHLADVSVVAIDVGFVG
jgi:hypothetical protein